MFASIHQYNVKCKQCAINDASGELNHAFGAAACSLPVSSALW